MSRITKTYTDAELLCDLSGSSDAAFTILYNKYWEKIYQVADFYLKDKSMVEDVVQEVFLIIWRKRAELTAITHFQHYLHTIARNLIISALRKKIPARQYALEHAFAIKDDDREPCFELEYKETAGLVTKAVDQLSPRQKEIYLMSNDKQLSLKDTAAQLNISYDTARQYKSEALKSIRGFLRKNVFRLFMLLLLFLFR